MEYADDVAVIDTDWRTVSTRTTRIGAATMSEGDLDVALEKYQVLHVMPRGELSPTAKPRSIFTQFANML